MNSNTFFETEILIIGAGPAGLACAMELFKKDKDFIILEKDSVAGGLSKTYKIINKENEVFLTDNGPHRFFSKNQYLYDFIEDVVGEDWIKVKRQTRQYIDGKFYDYPINPLQALKNIGILNASLMFVDYVYAKIKFGLFKKPIKNFEDYVEANFGKRLGEFNMINYTEKIWGIPAHTIHKDWASQRIKGLNLRVVIIDYISNLFSKKDVDAKSLVHEFYYPSNGSGQIYEGIVQKITDGGRKIFYNTILVKISKNRHGFDVFFERDGVMFHVKTKYIVESVPVQELLGVLDPTPKEDVLKKVHELNYRSQVYLFITFNKDRVTNDQWIYLPCRNISFGRVSEMKNFSVNMSPVGKTSLFVEFFCTEGDHIWNMSKEDLFNLFIKDSKDMNLFTREEIIDYHLFKKKNIYPVYDINYEEKAKVVKEYLDSIENFFAIGRPGRFRYNNQDHSLEMGIMAAKSIIDNKRYDIESVGSSTEYYEKK